MAPTAKTESSYWIKSQEAASRKIHGTLHPASSSPASLHYVRAPLCPCLLVPPDSPIPAFCSLLGLSPPRRRRPPAQPAELALGRAALRIRMKGSSSDPERRPPLLSPVARSTIYYDGYIRRTSFWGPAELRPDVGRGRGECDDGAWCRSAYVTASEAVSSMHHERKG